MKGKIRKTGFTLVELMVVAIILVMLASFVAPKVFKGLSKTKTRIAASKIGNIEGALGRFHIDCGRFPTDDEGLEALITPPPDLEDKWDGPYCKRSEIVDPWGNTYVYKAEGEYNIGGYDIISYGADGQPGGEGENADIYLE